MKIERWSSLILLSAVAYGAEAPVSKPPAAPTTAEVLAASKPSDWRSFDPENTLYVELASGRAIIELAPPFAPEHAANIKKLVRAKYFDGLAFLRSQDNYVVQWGDPNADNRSEANPALKARALEPAKERLPAEFTLPGGRDIPFTPLAGPDGYAPESGFSNGFPAARDPKSGQAWLAHCYGMVGVGRGDEPESGNGSEIYVVIGNAPRHLDRNIALVGRVISGMEILSTLPRGTGPLGFYEKPEQRVPIRTIRVGSDLPAAERANLEILKTDTPTFASLVESRRNRRESWFKNSAGYVELCNVPIPVRPAAAPVDSPPRRR